MASTIFFTKFTAPILAFLLFSGQSIVHAAFTTNEPEYHVFLKTEGEISQLQQAQGLIRVDATPTNASMHPSWPETLITIVITLASLLSPFLEIPWFKNSNSDIMEKLPGPFGLLWASMSGHPMRKSITKLRAIGTAFVVPIAQITLWMTTWGVAQKDHDTGGWVSANFASTGALLIPMIFWSVHVPSGPRRLVTSFLSALLSFQVVATLVITAQRYSSANSFGTVAYNITNTNGCTPFASLGFLQKGARTPVFSSVQLAQAILSAIAVFILFPLFSMVSLIFGVLLGVLTRLSRLLWCWGRGGDAGSVEITPRRRAAESSESKMRREWGEERQATRVPTPVETAPVPVSSPVTGTSRNLCDADARAATPSSEERSTGRFNNKDAEQGVAMVTPAPLGQDGEEKNLEEKGPRREEPKRKGSRRVGSRKRQCPLSAADATDNLYGEDATKKRKGDEQGKELRGLQEL